ncbi:hypothetical protein N7490_002337 [Penicillium lividum]|nr:hypothetical protein N7490_002337 [Penicillium lividum]
MLGPTRMEAHQKIGADSPSKSLMRSSLFGARVSYEEFTEAYTYYIKELMKRDLAFINLSRRGPEGKELPPNYEPMKQFASLIKYPGSKTMLMVNHEYTVAEADELVKTDQIDLITFARPFIYNPTWWLVKAGISFASNDCGGKVNYGPYQHPDEYYNDWPSVVY